jgi:hypothetical protein
VSRPVIAGPILGDPALCRALFLGSVFEFPGPENVLVIFHHYARAAEFHAFHFKPDSLVVAHFALQPNAAARSDYALPRQRIARLAK